MSFLKFAEGEPVPPLFQLSTPLNASRFELLGDGNLPFIVLYLSGMTSDEAKKIRLSQIESAYTAESYFWFGLIKIDEMIFELQFSPMEFFVHYGHFSVELFKDNQLVRILGVDSDSMKLIVIRCMTYPPKFSESIRSTFEGFEPFIGYDVAYNNRFLNTWRQFSVEKLWQKAEKTGFFHDTFL